MVSLYFYYAWPVFMSTTPQTGFESVPWVLVASLNAGQAVVNVLFVWVVVYIFGIKRFVKISLVLAHKPS